MSTLDLDLDSQMDALESEWRRAFEAGIDASAQYRALTQDREAPQTHINSALESLHHVELIKARIMAKIERLEECLGG